MLRFYSLRTALSKNCTVWEHLLSGQIWTKCPTKPDTQGAPRGGCSLHPTYCMDLLHGQNINVYNVTVEPSLWNLQHYTHLSDYATMDKWLTAWSCIWDYCMGKIVIYVTDNPAIYAWLNNFKGFWINACDTIKWTEILLCEYAICNLKHGPTFTVMCPCGTSSMDRSHVPYMGDKGNTLKFMWLWIYTSMTIPMKLHRLDRTCRSNVYYMWLYIHTCVTCSRFAQTWTIVAKDPNVRTLFNSHTRRLVIVTEIRVAQGTDVGTSAHKILAVTKRGNKPIHSLWALAVLGFSSFGSSDVGVIWCTCCTCTSVRWHL